MPAYAVAHMRQVTAGPAIVKYLERIDATLAPFGGRFLVHGGRVEAVEGTWPGHQIVIEYPDRARADAWYHSPPTRRSWACAQTTPAATSSSPRESAPTIAPLTCSVRA